MKKMISLMLAAISMITLSACGSAEGAGQLSAAETSAMNAISVSSGISASANVPENAPDALGADLYEIVPKQPYTEADLAYYTNGRADQEQSDPAARPVIAGVLQAVLQKMR